MSQVATVQRWRRRHWLLHAVRASAAGVSLLLALGCVALGTLARGDHYLTAGHRPESDELPGPGDPILVFAARGGRFQLIYDNDLRDLIPIHQVEFAGFGYASFGKHGWTLWVPWWSAAALFGAGPILWVWRTRRRVTPTDGDPCPACGYDLRASPERCPECGAARAAPAETA